MDLDFGLKMSKTSRARWNASERKKELDRSTINHIHEYVSADEIRDLIQTRVDKLTKTTLAENTGIPYRTLYRIFNGKSKFVSINIADILCLYFDVYLPEVIARSFGRHVLPELKLGPPVNNGHKCSSCGIDANQRTRGCLTCNARHSHRLYIAKKKKKEK